jgi:hypothetical protein
MVQENPSVQEATSPTTNHLRRYSSFLIGILVFLVLVFIPLISLHLLETGYSSETTTLDTIEVTTIVNKEEIPTHIQTIVIKNEFITPRKYKLPLITACLTDLESTYDTILLEPQYTINKSSLYFDEETLSLSPGNDFWITPFSEVQINLYVSGDWYDYIFQYLNYDEIRLLSIEDNTSIPTCDELVNYESVERITLTEMTGYGRVEDIEGSDLAVIDFIANDDNIWEGGYISFIPIIMNLGTDPSGSFTVTYLLNGRPQSSFKLENLDSGEIVNNFIAGSGFGGNMGVNESMEMELRVVVEALEVEDVNPDNNEFVWNFNYSDVPLPKHTCSYTDNNQGPEDFYEKTSINFNGRTYQDFCVSDVYVLEYVCDDHPVYEGDDSLDVFLYECPDGCQEGACIMIEYPGPPIDNP